MNKDIIKAAFYQTCGIGWLSPELGGAAFWNSPTEPSKLNEPGAVNHIGSGFFVTSRSAMTAHHVLSSLLNKGIQKDAFFVSRTVHPADGPGVTYFFEVEEYIEFSATLSDGRAIEKGRPQTDFAVLRTKKGSPEDALQFADPASIDIGDEVMVLGYFHGERGLVKPRVWSDKRRGPIVVFGHVGSVTRQRVLEGDVRTLDVFVDITAERGMSGGPCVRSDGKVIGLLTSGFQESPTVLSIGNDGETVPQILPLPQGIARILPPDIHWPTIIQKLKDLDAASAPGSSSDPGPRR